MEGIEDADIVSVGSADVLVVDRVRDCLPCMSVAIAEGIGGRVRFLVVRIESPTIEVEVRCHVGEVTTRRRKGLPVKVRATTGIAATAIATIRHRREYDVTRGGAGRSIAVDQAVA